MIDPSGTDYALSLIGWGLLLATVAGPVVEISWRLSMLGRRPRPAPWRYRSAALHLTAIAVLPVIAIAVVVLLHLNLGPVLTREPPAPRLVPTLVGSGVAPLLLLAWMTGVVAMAARLLTQHRSLARHSRSPATSLLVDQVALLARRFGLSRRIVVMVGDVAVPQVTGVRTPTLTLSSSLERLSAEEREAVLLHELAHVARRDVATNLVLRITLALVWFQPVAWFMYRRLSAEREVCCDRLAIARGASRGALGRALVALNNPEFDFGTAMAISGHGSLSWRLSQLIPAAEPELGHRGGPAIAGAIVLSIAAFCGGRMVAADARLTDLYVASSLGPVVAVSARDPAGSFGLRILRGRVIDASVEAAPLSAGAIRQDGDRVTLLDDTERPVVSLRVSSAGRINWNARRPVP